MSSKQEEDKNTTTVTTSQGTESTTPPAETSTPTSTITQWVDPKTGKEPPGGLTLNTATNPVNPIEEPFTIEATTAGGQSKTITVGPTGITSQGGGFELNYQPGTLQYDSMAAMYRAYNAGAITSLNDQEWQKAGQAALYGGSHPLLDMFKEYSPGTYGGYGQTPHTNVLTGQKEVAPNIWTGEVTTPLSEEAPAPEAKTTYTKQPDGTYAFTTVDESGHTTVELVDNFNDKVFNYMDPSTGFDIQGAMSDPSVSNHDIVLATGMSWDDFYKWQSMVPFMEPDGGFTTSGLLRALGDGVPTATMIDIGIPQEAVDKALAMRDLSWGRDPVYNWTTDTWDIDLAIDKGLVDQLYTVGLPASIVLPYLTRDQLRDSGVITTNESGQEVFDFGKAYELGVTQNTLVQAGASGEAYQQYIHDILQRDLALRQVGSYADTPGGLVTAIRSGADRTALVTVFGEENVQAAESYIQTIDSLVGMGALEVSGDTYNVTTEGVQKALAAGYTASQLVSLGFPQAVVDSASTTSADLSGAEASTSPATSPAPSLAPSLGPITSTPSGGMMLPGVYSTPSPPTPTILDPGVIDWENFTRDDYKAVVDAVINDPTYQGSKWDNLNKITPFGGGMPHIGGRAGETAVDNYKKTLTPEQLEAFEQAEQDYKNYQALISVGIAVAALPAIAGGLAIAPTLAPVAVATIKGTLGFGALTTVGTGAAAVIKGLTIDPTTFNVEDYTSLDASLFGTEEAKSLLAPFTYKDESSGEFLVDVEKLYSTMGEGKASAALAASGYNPTIPQEVYDKLPEEYKPYYTRAAQADPRAQDNLLGAYFRGTEALYEPITTKLSEGGLVSNLAGGMFQYFVPHTMATSLYAEEGAKAFTTLIPHFGPTAAYTGLAWEDQKPAGRVMGIVGAALPFVVGPIGAGVGKGFTSVATKLSTKFSGAVGVASKVIRVPGAVADAVTFGGSKFIKPIIQTADRVAPWQAAYTIGKSIPGYGPYFSSKGWLGSSTTVRSDWSSAGKAWGDWFGKLHTSVSGVKVAPAAEAVVPKAQPEGYIGDPLWRQPKKALETRVVGLDDPSAAKGYNYPPSLRSQPATPIHTKVGADAPIGPRDTPTLGLTPEPQLITRLRGSSTAAVTGTETLQSWRQVPPIDPFSPKGLFVSGSPTTTLPSGGVGGGVATSPAVASTLTMTSEQLAKVSPATSPPQPLRFTPLVVSPSVDPIIGPGPAIEPSVPTTPPRVEPDTSSPDVGAPYVEPLTVEPTRVEPLIVTPPSPVPGPDPLIWEPETQDPSRIYTLDPFSSDEVTGMEDRYGSLFPSPIPELSDPSYYIPSPGPSPTYIPPPPPPPTAVSIADPTPPVEPPTPRLLTPLPSPSFGSPSIGGGVTRGGIRRLLRGGRWLMPDLIAIFQDPLGGKRYRQVISKARARKYGARESKPSLPFAKGLKV